jgi:hypothetical protein
MSLLGDNQANTWRAPIRQAAKMRGNLLLISLMDDVHRRTRCGYRTTNAGRDAGLHLSPGHHGAACNQAARG